MAGVAGGGTMGAGGGTKVAAKSHRALTPPQTNHPCDSTASDMAHTPASATQNRERDPTSTPLFDNGAWSAG